MRTNENYEKVIYARCSRTMIRLTLENEIRMFRYVERSILYFYVVFHVVGNAEFAAKNYRNAKGIP